MIPETIDGAGVRLRAYTEGDVEAVRAGCDDPLTRRFLPLLPDPYTDADARWWIDTGAPAAFAGGGAAYAVVDPETDRLLGGIGLGRLVAVRQQIEMGYWVAPWARGRQVATAAVRALTEHAFAQRIARVELLTDWANVVSQRVALAAGFTREGVRRGACAKRDGGRDDVIVFARLPGDAPGPTPRLLPDLPGGELTDGVVALRPLTVDDIDLEHRLGSLPDVTATRVPPTPLDADEVTRRCTRSAARWLAGERADLVIVDAASGTPAGEIGLYYNEPQTGQAMLGYSMLPAWRGRGLTTRAVALLALWAFAETGIARLVAGTLPHNIASQRVLQKAGFRREGYLRSRLPGADGSRNDDVQFALIAADLVSGAG